MDNLETFFKQFENWVLWDISKMLEIDGDKLPDRETKDFRRPFVASVILVCCAIDVLAAFRYGKEDNTVGKYFKDFVKEYFTKENTFSGKAYDVNRVYNSLRNALVHGYSLGLDLALGHTDESVHLVKYSASGRIIIDVFLLYYDLEAVYRVYKGELLKGKYLDEFNKRWNIAPLIQFIPAENLKR